MPRFQSPSSLLLLLLGLCLSQSSSIPVWIKIRQPSTFWDYFQVSEGGFYSHREADNGKAKQFTLSERNLISRVKYILNCNQNACAFETVFTNPQSRSNLQRQSPIHTPVQLWEGEINLNFTLHQDAKIARILLYTSTNPYQLCIFLGDFLLVCLAYCFLRHTRTKQKGELWLQLAALAICLLCQEISHLQEALENYQEKGWKIVIAVPFIATFYEVFAEVLRRVLQSGLCSITQIILNALAAFCLIQTYGFPLLAHFTLSFLTLLTHSTSYLQIISLILSFRVLLSKQIYILPITIPQNLIWMSCLLLCQSSLWMIISHSKQLQHKNKQKALFPTIYEGDDSCVKVNENIQYCAICLDSISNNYALTPCSHKFHISCLNQWLAKSETCPIDRKPVLVCLR